MKNKYQTNYFERIIFWEPTPSPHKIDLITEISMQLKNCSIEMICDHDLPKSRRDLGWLNAQSTEINIIIKPAEKQIQSRLNLPKNSVLHIFSGVRHLPLLRSTSKIVAQSGGHYAIMSEPRVYDDWKAPFRFIDSWLFEGIYRSTSLAVFSIGANGRKWFSLVGYKNNKIIDYAYYVKKKEISHKAIIETKKVTIGYIGRLEKLKGVEFLIYAIKMIPNKTKLLVVGDGSQKQHLKNISESLDIDAEFLGSKPMQEIPNILSGIDIVVLPSITVDDGWGVVVNEALFSGARVVTTEKVGASAALINQRLGLVVKSKSSSEIANAIVSLLSDDLSNLPKNQIRDEVTFNAHKILSPEVGANIFIDSINNFGKDRGVALCRKAL